MPSQDRRVDRAERLVGRSLLQLGDDLREARFQAGLSQRELGATIGLSHSSLSRIERGEAREVPYRTLVRIAGQLGMDIPLRAYPRGDPVRDQAQLAVLRRLRTRLAPGLGWRLEVTLDIPGDLRAWDAVVIGRGWHLPVEAETRVRDLQALLRRLSLKQRDGNEPRILLALNDSRHNRHVLRLAANEVAANFPTPGRSAVEALAHGRPPDSSAVVLV